MYNTANKASNTIKHKEYNTDAHTMLINGVAVILVMLEMKNEVLKF